MNPPSDSPTPNPLSQLSQSSTKSPKRPPKPPSLNPLQLAIQTFLDTHHPSRPPLLTPIALPKRYTLHPPLLLLPPTFPAQIYVLLSRPPPSSTPDNETKAEEIEIEIEIEIDLTPLFHLLTSPKAGFPSPLPITHIAYPSPIPAILSSGLPNTIRSPSNLVPVWGDWGPSSLLSPSDPEPTEADFAAAFWVTTLEAGIDRIWAPRWSMFSRGNSREKQRILQGEVEGLAEERKGLNGMVAAVDMFVGVGYFGFSYLKRGVGVVWGWDLNAWSIEGARRGAGRNGWGVRVLSFVDKVWEDELGRRGGEVWRGLVRDLNLRKGDDGMRVRAVLVQADNDTVGEIFGKVREEVGRLRKEKVDTDDLTAALNVRHVNLGLLPTSRCAWSGAVELLTHQKGASWVHVHENVEIEGIQTKSEMVVEEFERLLRDRGRAECVHIERVKTYAPGVIHCVFDIRIDINDQRTAKRDDKHKRESET